MVEAMFDLIVLITIEVVVIGTARGVVLCMSFGAWRGERTGLNEGRIYGTAGALSFKRDGQRVLTRTGLLFVGLAFYVFLAVAFVAFLGAKH